MGILESLPVQRIRPVGLWPFLLGTMRDHSGFGNHAVPAGGYWSTSGASDGLAIPSHTQRATVPDSPELQTNGHVSIFAWTDIQRLVFGTVVAKSDGGGTDYEFYVDGAGNIAVWDGAGVSSFAHDMTRAKSLAVTMSNGAVPAFSVDGAFVGNGGVPVVVTANDAPLDIGALYVGNPWINPLHGVLIYTDILTPSEISDLHDWSQRRFTPRKRWPGGGLDIPTLTGTAREPVHLDSIQTSRVSLVASETSGKLSNTGYDIESGGFIVAEDAATGERYIKCVTAGIISRRNIEAYGTWEFEFYKADASNLNIYPIASMIGTAAAAGQNCYRALFTNLEQIAIQRYDNGAFGSTLMGANAGYFDPVTRYKTRFTRSPTGIFYMYIKGGAFTEWVPAQADSGANPATDNTHTTSKYFVIDAAAGDRIYFDRQFAGVVSPI